MYLFKKTWNDSDVIGIVYTNFDKNMDRKLSVKLSYFAKDACNKKNNTPRPKITFKRCYDLKEGFESVSNFYEVNPDKFAEIKALVGKLNKENEKLCKPKLFWKNREHDEIHILGKYGVLFLISTDNELFIALKDNILSLVE